MSDVTRDVAAVVVDYHADHVLVECVDSLRSEGIVEIVVVENGVSGSVPPALSERGVVVVSPGLNLGYGRGVNRGVAHTHPSAYVLVSNPDVVVHPGAVATMTDYLDAHPKVGLVGPRILRPDGSVYPSVRVFPNVWLAGLHAVLSPVWATNPATRRYRSPRADGTPDWVSGACFLVRRDVFESVGGFDERYFMFAEEMALCWGIREEGFAIAAVEGATVTHLEGVSRARAPRQMLVAHHRSALRFEFHTARGARRALAPIAAIVLSLRLLLVLVARPRS